MDYSFDSLLNKKCSWSYRSQKTTHTHNMEVDTNSFNVQGTFLIEALQNGNNTQSEKKNNLNVSYQIDLQKNSVSPDYEQIDRSEINKKTNMLTNDENLGKEPESENVVAMSVDNISKTISKTSDTHNDQTLIYENAKSYNSSSDEEVFQTRFTVQNKTFMYEDEHISNKNSASEEENVKTPESNLETNNTSPLIIQAKAFDENKKKDPTIKINSEMEQTEKQEMVGGNSLSVETDNSNIEAESNNMKNLVENNELIVFNNKKDRNEISEDAKETTESDNSLNQNAKESNDELTNLVIQEFLNGSFDINAYQPLPLTNKEKSRVSSNQSMNNKVAANKRNITNNNKYNKKTFEIFMATKKTKQNNLNKSMKRDDWLVNSPCTSIIGLKRKNSNRQTEDSKKAKIMTSTSTSKQLITERPNEIDLKPSCKLNDKCLKAKKEVNITSSTLEKYVNVLNSFGRKKQDIDKIKTKCNAVRTKNYKKKKVSTQFSYHDSPIKRNSKNKRHSSLIASQKIKDIEKLENFESTEEIYLQSDDSNFDFNSMQIEDKNEKILQHSKTNHTLKSKNEFKNDKISIQNISNVSNEDLQSYSTTTKHLQNSRVTRSKYKMFKDAFDFISKSPLKKNDGGITNKYFTPKIDFLDNCFILENESFNNRRNEAFKRKNKKSEIPDLNHDLSNELTSCKSNAKNKIPFKNAATQSRHKTWDMLEKELLGEFNDAQFTNNISKTIILKEEKLVRKSNIKNSNVYAVSNRSMTQTVSKSTEGKRYNMQYKIQNTESKYLETRTNMFDTTQQRDISNKPKNAVLEKTIAAMERCTAEFLKPEVDVIDSEKKIERLQFTDIFDGLNNDETEFHSNVTFMANKNEQYFQNEIVSVLKKSTTRKKNRNTKGNISYDENNCTDVEKEFEYSKPNKNLENSFIATNCILNKNVERMSENKNWELISVQEKQINPWEKLMRELNLEKDVDKGMHKKDTFQKLLPKSYVIKKDLNKEKNCKQGTTNDTENKVSKQMTNKEVVVQCHKLSPANSPTANIYEDGNIEITRNFDKMSKLDNKSLTKKVEKSTKKIPRNTKVAGVQKEKSPKFKLQLKKDGGLKFQKYVSRSSSRSSSLEKFVKSKPNAKNECSNDRIGTRKKKYEKYVKKLFNAEETLLKNSNVIQDKTGSMKIQNKDNECFEGSKDQRKRVNLISQNEEDFFSLSSSDSEVDNEKNQGSGLLFDLFEE